MSIEKISNQDISIRVRPVFGTHRRQHCLRNNFDVLFSDDNPILGHVEVGGGFHVQAVHALSRTLAGVSDSVVYCNGANRQWGKTTSELRIQLTRIQTLQRLLDRLVQGRSLLFDPRLELLQIRIKMFPYHIAGVLDGLYRGGKLS